MILKSLCLSLTISYMLMLSCAKDPQDHIGTLSFSSTPSEAINESQQDRFGKDDEKLSTTVYVCQSKGAKKYHLLQTCRGLSRCKHQVVSIAKSDAQNRGFGLCRHEQ
jgi:hypothetical protein